MTAEKDRLEQPAPRCPECRHAPHDDGPCFNLASDNDCECTYGSDYSTARRVVRVEAEFVRKQTVEFDLPNFATGMGEAGWGEHAVGVMFREMWVKTYGERRSMDETVNFQRWRVVVLCDAEHQGYAYEHGPWERVPKSDSLSICTRCGKRSGK